MHSGGATTPGVLARREPDVAAPDTLTLAAWRRSDALRRSHEACGNCDRAFRSELGHCPTCEMPSGALTTDPVPAVLERVATTSRSSQKLKCLQGREQPVALQPGVAWDSAEYNAATAAAAREVFGRRDGGLLRVEPDLSPGAAIFDDFLAMRTAGELRFRTREQVLRFVGHSSAVGLVVEFVTRMGLRVEVQAQDGTLEHVQVRPPQQPRWGGDGSAADLARCCWQSLPKGGYFLMVASCMDEADVRRLVALMCMAAPSDLHPDACTHAGVRDAILYEGSRCISNELYSRLHAVRLPP